MVASFVYSTRFLLLLFVLASYVVSAAAFDSSSCDATIPNGSSGFSSSTSSSLRNAALVFLKPHANTPAAQKLVRQTLGQNGISIISETSIDAETIEREKLIDQHYYAIASKATLVTASKIPVPEHIFESEFGEAWKTVVKEKRALNALEACQRWQYSAEQLGEVWQNAEKTVKFGGGFYCARIRLPKQADAGDDDNDDDTAYYVFNGFFLTMRSKFVQSGASIFCFEVEWDPQTLSWADFRNKVLGPTDPRQAPKGSLRRTILDQYRKLGLDEAPNKGLNGVHGSASPLEGLVERMNWLRKNVSDDAYGKALLAAGLSKGRIREWSIDPRVKINKEKEMKSLFDALEEMDADECLEELVRLSKL